MQAYLAAAHESSSGLGFDPSVKLDELGYVGSAITDIWIRKHCSLNDGWEVDWDTFSQIQLN